MAVEYSSNEAIDNVRGGDDNIEVRGYVDAIPGRSVVGVTRRLNLFKFVINNGAGKRIQCLAWEKEVDRVAEIVAMNKILHIEAGQAKLITVARYNMGNTHFELNIRSITMIEDEGYRVMEPVVHADIPEVDWDEVADREGDIICIAGWVKSNFRESPHFNNESSFGFGSITNGLLKLEVRLTSVAGLPDSLERGEAVKITGKVLFGTYLYVKLESGADIVRIEEEAFEASRMLNITSPPVKRQRRE